MNNYKLSENFDFNSRVAREAGQSEKQVKSTLELLASGNTIPFIARYRKEQTGGLDENVILDISERYESLKKLVGRKEEVLNSIAEQGKMTDELFARISACDKLQAVDDIYLPFRPKKRTRATIARELGLAPLAELIASGKSPDGTVEQCAAPFVDVQKGVATVSEAIEKACDIIAEDISDNADFRAVVRDYFKKKGILRSQKKVKRGAAKDKADEPAAAVEESHQQKNNKSVPGDYEIYLDYREPVCRIPPHRVLAINRGESEEHLTVKIEFESSEELNAMARKFFVKNEKGIFAEAHSSAVEDGLKRLVIPSISNEIRNDLTQTAEKHAIRIFAENLGSLLMQPPITGKVIMGLDPGFRAGTKVAVIDANGKLLDHIAVYPHPPQNDAERAKKVLCALIKKHGVEVIAIGNGTASRETETLVAEMIREYSLQSKYAIVSEAGASVYSASKVANYEFPDLDVLIRSAISIARRVLDPLSELVKVDPKSIGVGEYQHDVDQKELSGSLDFVVTSCVNRVGVNLNTASFSLLKYISGLNESQAVSIVKYREENGAFASRSAFKKVPKIGEKAFEQAAGFLRVAESSNPLDNTWIHPESYSLAEKIIERRGLSLAACHGREGLAKLREIFVGLPDCEISAIAKDLQQSEQTVRDIVAALKKPALDPRDELPKTAFRADILSIGDIQIGQKLTGTVRNVVDFGAFVDIGIKNDALCHVSHCSDRFVKHPLEVLKIGNILEFTVIAVDTAKGRVSLSLKSQPFAERPPKKDHAAAPTSQDQNRKQSRPVEKPAAKISYEERMRDNFTSVEIKFTTKKK